ncbi:platelet-derived growth factor D [Periophthalmus magnuspinnatus]|uniref:platelet-derived growth factor D n=1 Tax=Periophthalmus magnuspinnatus TaxID=409849 RepID=UPI002436D231|nr:platelet-derived growth factor D [Periophthalmus magnuspinnatus]
MSGRALFHLWMLLFLGCSSEVARAQVANAKVMRGNTRGDDLYHREESINVTQLAGVIHSPRYPEAYPRNLLLSWKLMSPPGSRIHLVFDKKFGLEGPTRGVCSNDYVEVEDLARAASIIWGRWCGHRAPSSLNSKNNILRVTFKSNDYFVAKPGFKIHYSILYDPPVVSPSSEDALLMSDFGAGQVPATVPAAPFSLEDLDRTIAAFNTIEELLKSLNPDTWKQDLDSIYTADSQILYRSRAYHLASRHNKVDLNRLYDDVKRYSCTPRNFSVNLREELRVTSAVFFPRCLLVKRCGGNCACGTDYWNSGCTCQPSKSTQKLHEVLKYSPDMSSQRHHRSKVRWVIGEIFLTHHEQCECSCPYQPPR